MQSLDGHACELGIRKCGHCTLAVVKNQRRHRQHPKDLQFECNLCRQLLAVHVPPVLRKVRHGDMLTTDSSSRCGLTLLYRTVSHDVARLATQVTSSRLPYLVHFSALGVGIQAIGSDALPALSADTLRGVFIHLSPLRVNKEASTSLALASEAAQGGGWIVLYVSPLRMDIGTLRTLAGSAILTDNAAGSLPWELDVSCNWIWRLDLIGTFWHGLLALDADCLRAVVVEVAWRRTHPVALSEIGWQWRWVHVLGRWRWRSS
mmetsp:Transcript_65228/g.155794  ORF Transcript_65228/g.155794 Transcript_65228/m.155794 type:complete len:262 (+) Transcript_65228:1957-2742(+)